MILLQRVSHTFREGPQLIRALDDVSLYVPAGSTLALVGRSGSGKSTLLHLVGGLEPPARGRVVVEGRPLHRLGDQARTRFRLTRVGFVFQFFHLLPALTVRENLLLPAEMAGLAREVAAARLARLMAEVGLSNRLDALPDRLSGGEQQRVAIARSLMLEPPLLLADEPTGALDSETGDRVLALMLALVRERGTTLVLATHNADVAALTDRVVELRDGRVVADSAPAAPPAPGRAARAARSR